MKEIEPKYTSQSTITVEGSKSYTHRILIAAALAPGTSILHNHLRSEDTELTAQALGNLGITITDFDKNTCRVTGLGGSFSACDIPIFLGNSGTSIRLLTGISVLGKGQYHFTGVRRMDERPMDELLRSLKQIGIRTHCLKKEGYPPLTLEASQPKSTTISIDCSLSSQYLSSLLLLAPCTENGLKISVSKTLVSKPYIDLTMDILDRFGIHYKRTDYAYFDIPGNQTYRCGTYTIEPDYSNASYFWAAAAITGSKVCVKHTKKNCSQGDAGFVSILEKMGCTVEYEDDGITITGPPRLHSVIVSMEHMPDVVPSLAIVAAFAKGETIIKNVSSLRFKECDRLYALHIELSKMGIDIKILGDDCHIQGGIPHGTTIETYNDHRIAMSFALMGLRVPGVKIVHETCVNKSFPTFWETFTQLQE